MSNCAYWLNCSAWICACWVFVETLNMYLQLSTYFWAFHLTVQILPPPLVPWSTHANSMLLQQIPWATREASFAKSVKFPSIKSSVTSSSFLLILPLFQTHRTTYSTASFHIVSLGQAASLSCCPEIKNERCHKDSNHRTRHVQEPGAAEEICK